MKEPTDYVYIPISRELYAHLFLRNPKAVGARIPSTIEAVVWNYLERTEYDGDWDEAYFELLEESKDDEAFQSKYGDPKAGYTWGQVYLPNGSRLRMRYKGEDYFAEVCRQQIRYEGEDLSPSQFCNRVSGSQRNAWTALQVRRPKDTRWHDADDLRRGRVQP